MRLGRRDWASGVATLLGLQAALLLIWFAVEGGRPGADSAPSAAPAVSAPLRAPAPGLVYLDGRGEERRLSDHRGRPVLVHFWATWCAPCVEELPTLLEVSEQRGLPLLAVSIDQDRDAVEGFFDGPPPDAVAWAPEGRVDRAFGLTSLPQTLVVDAEGRLRLRLIGPRDWRDPRVVAEVRAALRGHPGE